MFATAQRLLPLRVIGPVDLPPWNIQTRFPLEAAFLHCCLLRFDKAWHLEDPSIDAVKRAELGLRFLGKIGFDTTLQYSLLNLDDLHL